VPDDQLLLLLERVVIGSVGLTTRALAEAAPGGDLTFPQWRAMLVVGEGSDGLRVGQVASRVGVTLPATSRLLRRLERRGLMELGPDPVDRRATRARLTAAGVAARAAVLDYRRAELRETAARLDAADQVAALEELASLLGRYA
jgi:DNA-binding MarR family transcriptional regulator